MHTLRQSPWPAGTSHYPHFPHISHHDSLCCQLSWDAEENEWQKMRKHLQKLWPNLQFPEKWEMLFQTHRELVTYPNPFSVTSATLQNALITGWKTPQYKSICHNPFKFSYKKKGWKVCQWDGKCKHFYISWWECEWRFQRKKYFYIFR